MSDPYFEGPGPGFVSVGMVWKVGHFEVRRGMTRWELRDAEGAVLGEYLFGFRAFRAAKFANAAADAVFRTRGKP